MIHAFILALASLRSRKTFAGLSVMSVAAAIALLCALYLLSASVSDGIQRNSRGIDMIVGATGSKLQLVLSSIYHADIPTGNIDEETLVALRANPQVKSVIPMVIGDSHRGWRVLGTTSDYIDLYRGTLASGRKFAGPFEIVAGASTNLKIGDKFAAVHGLSQAGGDVHDAHIYQVVGILDASGTVLDRLLLTSVDSVQQLHAGHEHAERHHDEHVNIHEENFMHQITAALVKTRSPLGAMTLPRQIDRMPGLVAANPAYEMTRLSMSLGLGKNLVAAIAVVTRGLAVLMLFSMLAAGLASRRYDLAVLRSLGATRSVLFATILFEGLLIGMGGAVLGVACGHVFASMLAAQIESLQAMIVPGEIWRLRPADCAFTALGALAGILASLPPAITAFKLDIAHLLSRGS